MSYLPNIKFKEMRQRLGFTQFELAEKLDVSQGTITDIERGRIEVSKRVQGKLKEKLDIDYYKIQYGLTEILETEKGIENNKKQYQKAVPTHKRVSFDDEAQVKPFDETKDDWATFVRKNKDVLQKVAREKIKYNELFHNQLSIENPDLETFYKSLNTIRDFRWALDSIEESKAGAVHVLFQTFLDDPYLTTALPPFKDYKAERVKALTEIEPYANIFNELASAINIFHSKMSEAGEKLDYKNEFYDETITQTQSE